MLNRRRENPGICTYCVVTTSCSTVDLFPLSGYLNLNISVHNAASFRSLHMAISFNPFSAKCYRLLPNCLRYGRKDASEAVKSAPNLSKSRG